MHFAFLVRFQFWFSNVKSQTVCDKLIFTLLLLFHAIIFSSFPGSHLFSLFQMGADENTLSVSEHISAS